LILSQGTHDGCCQGAQTEIQSLMLLLAKTTLSIKIVCKALLCASHPFSTY
jgi:hypothetical protein